MHALPTFPTAAGRWLAATAVPLAALALGACAGPLLPPPPTGAGGLTVQGQYEVIAACLADVSRTSNTGAASLAVDRSARRAVLARVLQPSNARQYELVIAQAGATTVQVEGRVLVDSADARNGFSFLWSQTESCARDRMAP